MYKYNKQHTSPLASAFKLLVITFVMVSIGLYIGAMAFLWSFKHGVISAPLPIHYTTTNDTTYLQVRPYLATWERNIQPAARAYYTQPTVSDAFMQWGQR